MESWARLTLGEIIEVYQPHTISKKAMKNGNHNVYGANGIIGTHDEYNHAESEVVLGCRGSCGFVRTTKPQSWINGNAMVVRALHASMSRRFLAYALKGGVHIEEAITGSAQPQITQKSLYPLEIYFPTSRREQEKIADKLDTTLAAVEACKEKLNNAAETIQRFRQSVLAAAVSGELTREWRENNTAGIDISASDKLEPATLPEGYRRLKKQAIKESRASWPNPSKPEHWKIVSIETLYKLNYILDFADGNHGSLYPRKSEFSDKGITF